jgi:hypothetical protein
MEQVLSLLIALASSMQASIALGHVRGGFSRIKGRGGELQYHVRGGN